MPHCLVLSSDTCHPVRSSCWVRFYRVQRHEEGIEYEEVVSFCHVSGCLTELVEAPPTADFFRYDTNPEVTFYLGGRLYRPDQVAILHVGEELNLNRRFREQQGKFLIALRESGDYVIVPRGNRAFFVPVTEQGTFEWDGMVTL